MIRKFSILTALILILAGCGDDINQRSTLEELLADGAVIDHKGNRATASYVLNTEFTLLYFSAHWCPPCQAFTPKLVDYYNKEGGGHLFQILFVSSDHGEREMLNYMKETRMPWPAVVYHSKSNKILQKRYSGSGIPRLVLVNNEGKIIADSFKGDDYLGPNHVLEVLDKKLGKRKYDPVGLSEATGQALPTRKKLEKKYKVEGMGGTGTKKMAFINGKVYQKGAELDEGVIISEITDTYVEISLEGNRYQLKPKE